MKRLRLPGLVSGAPAALALVCLLPGCAPRPAPAEGRPPEATSRGTLEGEVTLRGDPPDLAALDRELRADMARHAGCLRGDKEEVGQQKYRIGARGGVANVVVWLLPPEGDSFKMSADDLDPRKAGWGREVVLRTPHCAFLPHVAVAFPSYPDPRSKKQVRTGQVFKVKNTGTIAHVLDYSGRHQPHYGRVSPPTSGPEETFEFVPDTSPIMVKCGIHPWMYAYVWAFDHPYAAVTDRDGRYVIRNAPAGVKLRVQAWHEEAGWLAQGGGEGDPVEIEAGAATRKSFTLRVPKP